MARSIKMKNGLTPQQNNFKNNAVKQILTKGTLNGTEAALESYNTKDRKVAQVIASENLSIPIIKDSIERTLKDKGINLEYISENIKELASSKPEKYTADSKLRANLELLKLLGAYPNQKQISVSFKADLGALSYAEVKSKLSEVDQELTQVMQEGDIQG